MDAATPLVSVIMSVHNGEQWLKEAIDSIVHQTYGTWEFIIIDDASNEATQNILRSYTDSRIKIFRKEVQQGLTKNLNTAINLCKGEFIARMDGDDISLPERFEKQINYLCANESLSGCAGWVLFINERSEIIGKWEDERRYNTPAQIARVIIQKNILAHPSVMFRSEIMRQFMYNEQQTHSQDWDLWLRLSANDKKIAKLKEVILLYRIHNKSITVTSKTKSIFQKIDEVYKLYLASLSYDRKKKVFNRRVKKASFINKNKLFLSRIKRVFRL
jgi:glycosyltransferase involved in cell wall biosynthesis